MESESSGKSCEFRGKYSWNGEGEEEGEEEEEGRAVNSS